MTSRQSGASSTASRSRRTSRWWKKSLTPTATPELGAAYRFGFVALSLQPSISIGYQREEVDAYTEGFDAAFQRPVGEQQFVRVGEDAIIDPFDGRSRSTIRSFNDQTIESIPLKTGVLFSAPLGDPAADFRLSNVALGALYTHDFENQRYNVKALSINSPPLSVDYREKNRNQDFLSFTGALDFKLGVVRGTISHQQDVGFDERQRAYIVRLQLRVPVSF
jgi:hypothetical protein